MLHGFGDELKLAAGLVDAEAAADADGVAVAGTEAQQSGLAAEEDEGELGVAVLQGEVAVAAGGGSPVGDLAFDGNVGVGLLDEGADAADQLGNSEDSLLAGLNAGLGRLVEERGSGGGCALLAAEAGEGGDFVGHPSQFTPGLGRLE